MNLLKVTTQNWSFFKRDTPLAIPCCRYLQMAYRNPFQAQWSIFVRTILTSLRPTQHYCCSIQCHRANGPKSHVNPVTSWCNITTCKMALVNGSATNFMLCSDILLYRKANVGMCKDVSHIHSFGRVDVGRRDWRHTLHVATHSYFSGMCQKWELLCTAPPVAEFTSTANAIFITALLL